MAHRAVGVEIGAVEAGDAGGFLPAMLERVEAQRDERKRRRHRCRIRRKSTPHSSRRACRRPFALSEVEGRLRNVLRLRSARTDVFPSMQSRFMAPRCSA
jgi:hypothetical protein